MEIRDDLSPLAPAHLSQPLYEIPILVGSSHETALPVALGCGFLLEQTDSQASCCACKSSFNLQGPPEDLSISSFFHAILSPLSSNHCHTVLFYSLLIDSLSPSFTD